MKMSDFSAMRVAGADTELSNERGSADLSNVHTSVGKYDSADLTGDFAICPNCQR